MENDNNKEELSLQQQIEIGGMINMVKGFLPDVAKYVPMIKGGIEKIIKSSDDYLDNGGKIVILFNVGGKSRGMVIDATKDFEIKHDTKTGTKIFNVEKQGILENYPIEKFIEDKILSNPSLKYALNILNSEYEQKYKSEEPEQENTLGIQR